MLEEKRKRVEQTVAYLNNRKTINPKIAIVLGSGLGGLTEKVEIVDEIPYKEIPNFPVSTVEGHKGTMIFGRLNGVAVLGFNGRFHYYEGYPVKEIAAMLGKSENTISAWLKRGRNKPKSRLESGMSARIMENAPMTAAKIPKRARLPVGVSCFLNSFMPLLSSLIKLKKIPSKT